MTAADGESPVNARPGSGVDLSRRIDRLETTHEALSKEVGGLSTTITRVELNQQHAEEINKLRYDSMHTAIGQVEVGLQAHSDKVTIFMERIEKIMSGETVTQATRAGEALVAEYQKWRAETDLRLDAQDVLGTQVKLLGRLAVILVGGSVVTTVVAIYAAIQP